MIENPKNFFRIIITVKLANAPAKANAMLATLPNKNPTINILTTFIIIALSASNKYNANITAMFARPSLAPGIPIDGINVST